MPLVKDGRVIADPWVAVADGEPLPHDTPIVVTLERWRAERAALVAAGAPLGVRLAADQPPELVADDLEHLEVVALDFPAFTDGRAYSHARVLRDRYRYDGEIRAVGEVLRDQLLFMHRCGFDAFEVADEKTVAAVPQALAEISVPYQPAADSAPTAVALRRHRLAARRRAERLAERYGALDGAELLAAMIEREFPGRLAVVSSFGAETAVILDLVAEMDRATPVVFLDTAKHFPETLAYRDALVRRLGLTDVRSVEPDREAIAREDPDGELWRRNPDRCCHLRKVAPLERALAGFDAWVNGRKRYHGELRSDLPTIEAADGRIKINPLARWTHERVEARLDQRRLPRHPLAERGYRSIGCAPCTDAVAADSPMRAGRWSGTGKIECGIHRAKGAR